MKRSPRAKVIAAVMLVIITICFVFLSLLYRENLRSMQQIIDNKARSASIVAESIVEQTSIQYQLRIKSFINYKSSKTREMMIQAFANHDRQELQRLSKPFFDILQHENPHFSTLGWVLPDNHAFLRVHAPENFGQDVTKMRPDIAAVNTFREQRSGFTTGYIGLQYRVVEPVFYQNKYLGALQIGIEGQVLQEAIEKKLHAPAGVAIINSEYNAILKKYKKGIPGRTHTIDSSSPNLFQNIVNFDWKKKQYRITLDDKPYVIYNVYTLSNFRNKELGVLFVALDISQEIMERRSLIFSALLLSALLIGLSFVILYSSYGNLVQKIVNLNSSLEKNNRELESRVRERTAELLFEIEERKITEQKLHKAEKMEAIGLMAGGVAHDLNNILSGVVSYPEILLMQLSQEDKLYPPVKAIHESGLRAAAVVSDMLTVARSAANVHEIANINTVIKEYLASLEGKKLLSQYPDIKLVIQFASELHNIRCSPVHIKKCVMNLVINAAEALGNSGQITISTQNYHLEEDAIQKNSLPPGEYVALIVKDDGPGIAAKDLEHIFEPFYTKKKMGRSGTGLGLTVVWNAIQDHDGNITVESDKNGTSFTLLFPTSTDQTLSRPKKNITIENLRGNGEHILVVDDEPHQRNIASQLLSLLDYQVDTVHSGEEAIAFVRNQQVDLLLLDMLMDSGINGRQTYEEIIKIYPKQKAVIASGFSESDEIKQAICLGAGAFIKKPYTFEQLGLAIQTVLKKNNRVQTREDSLAEE